MDSNLLLSHTKSIVDPLAYSLLRLLASMRIMMPILRGRISSVLDTAGLFLLVEANQGQESGRREISIETTQIVARAKKIVESEAQVLICGAVSWPLEAILTSAGIQVIPNTCGNTQEILDAFLSGQMTEWSFLMPGCDGNRRRAGTRGPKNPTRDTGGN